MLEVNKISSFYGEFQVLENVSIKVNEGEFVIVFAFSLPCKVRVLRRLRSIRESGPWRTS